MFPVIWPTPLTPAIFRYTSVPKFSPTLVTTCTSPASETLSPSAPTQGLGGTETLLGDGNESRSPDVVQYVQSGAHAGDAQPNASTTTAATPAVRSRLRRS